MYGLYGAVDWLQPNLVDGGHSFPPSARQQAYNFLDKTLPPRPNLDKYEEEIPPSKEKWEKHREKIKTLLLRDIGPIITPDLSPTYEVLESHRKEGYIEKKIQYSATPNDTVRAYLLIPKNIQNKNPAMIIFHSTQEKGKDTAVGRAGRESIHFGSDLVRRGYIVLAPDSICAGERIDSCGPYETREVYQRYPSYSAMGKMIQDGRRALDILQTLPEVDVERIGTIGHSLGAEESLFVAAFDKRVKAAAASCGFAPFSTEADPTRWARDHWFSYMPRLRIDLRAGRLPAWDFDDVIRLIAPRGYFNYQTSDDQIFPEADSAHPLTLSAMPIWKLYEAENRLRSLLEPGPHDISTHAKNEVYNWLDSVLKDCD